ncbi:hypothetical protein DENSPDRAFT_365007 [Dentipellis sp. KUC8613]|nr:hypothetical protein DENSPDRAFT_365007 [Dentipellis sp. KUC8613]
MGGKNLGRKALSMDDRSDRRPITHDRRASKGRPFDHTLYTQSASREQGERLTLRPTSSVWVLQAQCLPLLSLELPELCVVPGALVLAYHHMRA